MGQVRLLILALKSLKTQGFAYDSLIADLGLSVNDLEKLWSDWQVVSAEDMASLLEHSKIPLAQAALRMRLAKTTTANHKPKPTPESKTEVA
jgi:hypothetical protein